MGNTRTVDGGYVALVRRLFATWAVLAAGLLALAVADTFVWRRAPPIASLYLFQQDMPLMLGAGLVLALLAGTRPEPMTRTWPRLARPWILALLVAVAGAAGTRFVFAGYPMSVDEFMATFDARIFASGRLFAQVPEAWRAYAGALQPIFMLETPGHAVWASAYLPVNAAIRALAGLAGASGLVNPLWSAASVLTCAAVARRLWPERPKAPWIAALLMTTSSQLVVTGMTAYAMPAHLALNLIWLWGFLRGGRLGHATALTAGFLATGLHQLVFHPLFAAPFILQLWTGRRWRVAFLYSLAYAAIGLFWLYYWTAALRLSGVMPEPGGGGGPVWLLQRVLNLLAAFDLRNTGAMAKDLFRFLVWQNPLTIPLAAVAAWPAIRRGGVLRAMTLGIGLSIAAIYVLLPYQDHGWGYRYLHGQLGSVCLLATWGWMEWTGRMTPGDQATATSAMSIAATASAVLLLPFCLWKAGEYVRPYAAAHSAIARTDADVVIVDDAGAWYAESLVRNDPGLTARPKVMKLDRLDEAQVRALCATHTVALFDRRDAARYGLRTRSDPRPDAMSPLRAVMAELGCGARPVGAVGR